MVATGTKSILGRRLLIRNFSSYCFRYCANLQHQRIKYIHRKIVHVKLEIIEDSDQTAYTEKCDNNQTAFHDFPPFLKNRRNTRKEANMLPKILEVANTMACHPEFTQIIYD